MAILYLLSPFHLLGPIHQSPLHGAIAFFHSSGKTRTPGFQIQGLKQLLWQLHTEHQENQAFVLKSKAPKELQACKNRNSHWTYLNWNLSNQEAADEAV